jgi:SAM-dependent methyltransferase
MKANWSSFFYATRNAPPSKLLVKALEFTGDPGIAIDVGSGPLRDARYLLSLGFQVTALDASPLVADEANKLDAGDRLNVVISYFDAFPFPVAEYDLVNAMYALPFNPPRTFDAMFARLKDSLKTGGVFCGQFFGLHDSWNREDSNMSFHTTAQVEEMLKDLEVFYFEEREWDGKTTDGNAKHWHVYNVIARKR